MKTKFLTGSAIAKALKQLIKDADEIYIAVAWASDNPAFAGLLEHQSKIRQLLIGTHFYQTSPALLERVKDLSQTKVMDPNGSATFHPKLYLFRSRDQVSAVIGSANFTNAAMTSNVEACVMLQGSPAETQFDALKSFIANEWAKGFCIDDDFLRAYRIQYEAKRDARSSLERFVPIKKPTHSARKADPLEMSWKDFVREVRADRHHGLDDRLSVLAHSRQLFAENDRFSELTEIQRKAIAGTLGKNEEEAEGVKWGWFGSMGGAGEFKKLVKDNSVELSAALDRIPLAGPVTATDYEGFSRHFRQAFDGLSRRGGISTASRLLSMRRPDYFVCYNAANKAGLSAHFGVTQSGVTHDTYWEYVIEPMTYSQWWRHARPRGVEGRIWDGRAALLDAIYYEPL